MKSKFNEFGCGFKNEAECREELEESGESFEEAEGEEFGE